MSNIKEAARLIRVAAKMLEGSLNQEKAFLKKSRKELQVGDEIVVSLPEYSAGFPAAFTVEVEEISGDKVTVRGKYRDYDRCAIYPAEVIFWDPVWGWRMKEIDYVDSWIKEWKE